MLNWEKIKKSYDIVKDGISKKVEGDGFKIYSMGKSNPVIRIDIKETDE